MKRSELCHIDLDNVKNPIHLDDLVLSQFIRQAEQVHFRKGQVLFYRHHLPCGFFILKGGLVSLGRKRLRGTSDEQHPCVVGLNELLNNQMYVDTCRAVSDVEALFLPKALFLKDPISHTTIAGSEESDSGLDVLKRSFSR